MQKAKRNRSRREGMQSKIPPYTCTAGQMSQRLHVHICCGPVKMVRLSAVTKARHVYLEFCLPPWNISIMPSSCYIILSVSRLTRVYP